VRFHPEDRGYTTPCHIYEGGHNQKGYGLVTLRVEGRPKTSRMAHVVAWEAENGPVPPGLEIDHLCEIRDCIRVSHLEAVTHTVNVRRSRATKLTDEQIEYIRSSPLGPVALGLELGVTREYVWRVRRGLSRAA
jgi:hypothetical protein